MGAAIFMLAKGNSGEHVVPSIPKESKMRQLSIMFEPGISQRSRTLREHLATRVYARGLVETAGKMDLSPSKLTEKLAGADSGGKPRGLTVDELEDFIERTNDFSPVHYLVEKYLNDPEVARGEAMAKLQATLDALPALMAAAGVAGKRSKP